MPALRIGTTFKPRLVASSPSRSRNQPLRLAGRDEGYSAVTTQVDRGSERAPIQRLGTFGVERRSVATAHFGQYKDLTQPSRWVRARRNKNLHRVRFARSPNLRHPPLTRD